MGLIRSATMAAVLLTASIFVVLPHLGVAQESPSVERESRQPMDRMPFRQRFEERARREAAQREADQRNHDDGEVPAAAAVDATDEVAEEFVVDTTPKIGVPDQPIAEPESDLVQQKAVPEQSYRSIVEQTEPEIDTVAEAEANRQTQAELDRFRGNPEWRRRANIWLPASSPEEIIERIDAHTPRDLEPTPDGLLPLSARRPLVSAWARLLESLADFEGAKDAYGWAIQLGANILPNWRGLGRMRVRTGEYEGAEAAFLAALQLSETAEAVDGFVRADIHRELGELYLAMGHLPQAVGELDRALEIVPGAIRAQQLWTLALAQIEGVDEAGELATSTRLWPETRAERWRAQIERGLDASLAWAPASVRRTIQSSATTRSAYVLGTLLGGLMLSWITLRVLRKTGDLVVEIHFPDELKGLFSVHVSTTQGRHRRMAGSAESPNIRRKSTRTSHHSVSRETHFLRLSARRYFVTVSGALNDPEQMQTLSEPWEEQSVDLVGNDTTRMVFDLSPRECPVDVIVRWDKGDPGEIGVAARGRPQSLRYAQGGDVRLRLPMGSHTVMVGSGDRVAEKDVEVASFQPTRIEINLTDSEHLVFKGCPPAVEPYLHGDLSGAARCLERDGHGSVAHLLLARLHQEQGQTERAAEQLESAGHNLEAAKLRESIADFEGAAALFENAGSALRAAESYLAAGDLAKAGELFESAGDWVQAADCYEQMGETESLIGVLERQGRYFDAAHLAEKEGDRACSVRLLQQVNRNDESYAEACLQLVSAFEHEGHADLAASKLEDYLSTVGINTAPDLQIKLADLFAKADSPARGLEILEALREREPTYPNIASRIETLRKLVSGRKVGEGGETSGSTATFVAAQRYEIIEEVGRGGMGLIFKAHDRRLNRIVALKRLPENLREHPKALQLFLNEAQAAARLNHPNIVTVYDTDQEDGTFFITMELLQGQPLNAILKQRGRLGPRDTARIGSQVAAGLQYAHDQHVVHRDIKSANLFLTHDKVVKIMDFGLAKMMEEVRRGTTVIGGTPSYMAPEQAAGDRVDHRADLYSLGITLFELATGRVPFDKGDVAYHHRHTEPPDPRSLVDDLADPLAELILRLIRKDPEARIGTAREVEQLLERMIHG